MASRFLYVTRHGEADGEDGSLTTRGEEQARRLGRRLTGVPLTAISHSPLPRATQTARLIGAQLPAVELQMTAEVDDYVPPFDGAPAEFAALLSDVSALTTILYRDDRPPELLAFNEASHLTTS
jgi:broad specificity phosphatase PhoE